MTDEIKLSKNYHRLVSMGALVIGEIHYSSYLLDGSEPDLVEVEGAGR